MVFRLDPDASLDDWLGRVRGRVRYAKGVLSKLCPDCPGVARTFIHLSAPEGTFRYEAAVVNSLGKVGLFLPERSFEARKE